ncbi:MAG: hypothetical protein M1490_04815 [Candidatus Bathyarchaeota archaeon]|nr:hypothetical protein [Candidatus Bathyarchaeota archaeon]
MEIKSGDEMVAITKHGITRHISVCPLKETEGLITGLDTENLRDKSDRIDLSRKKH